MLTLPQIVSQIREQKPGVVPEWFTADQYSLAELKPYEVYGTTEGDRDTIDAALTRNVAIAVLEAAMWRALSRKPGCSVDLRHWGWFATAERQTGGGLCFGHEPLSLILALCHAIGVRLGDE